MHLLGNRQLFKERLIRALDTARRHQDLVGVLFFDLDNFKGFLFAEPMPADDFVKLLDFEKSLDH